MRHLSVVIFATAIAVMGLGCGDSGSDGSGMKCGDGTEAKDGSCIAKDSSSLKCGDGTVEKEGVCAAKDAVVTCGDDTKEVDGKCVAKVSGPDGGLKCGDGTEEKDGACIAKDGNGLACGTGTVEKDGKCVSDPDATAELECGQGTVKDGKECVIEKMVVDGYDVTKFDLVLPKGGKGLVNYPVTANATIKATTPFNGHMHLTMTNYVEDMKAEDIYQCFLGAFQLQHPGGDQEVEISQSFTIPATCLYGDAGKGDKDATAKMYPVLSFNQQEDREPKDIAKASIRFADQAVDIASPPGVDIRLTATRPYSSVIVLQTVPDSVSKTPAGDLIYGAPEIKMTTEVTAFGTSVVDENGEPLNILDDDEVKVSFKIKPADENVTEWQPIFLHEEGDPAKADDEVAIANLDHALETEIIAQSPHFFNHGLYIEDDCGTKCDSPTCQMSQYADTCPQDGYCKLDPAKNECDAKAIARSMIMGGAWNDYDKFIIRTCVEGGGQHKTAADNDCLDYEIMIVRVDNVEPMGPGAGNDGNLNTVPYAKKTWTKNYGKSCGGSALKLSYSINSETAMRYWTPAFGTDNSAKINLSSKYVGNRDILKGWAKGHIAADKGWAYDYGLTAFGSKIWGGAESKPKATTYSKTWKDTKSWSKQKGWSFNFWAGPVPLKVTFGFKGSVNVGYGFTLKAGFTAKDAYADLKPYVKPGASLTGYASAGVNLVIATGGVQANITIISGNIPLTMEGKVTADPVKKKSATLSAKVNLKLSLTTLSGKLYAYAKLKKVKCKNWKPWSCYSYWSTVWTGNIISFSGYNWKYDIYSYNKNWTASW